MTSTATTGHPAPLLHRLLFNGWVCLALPLLATALFWAADSLPQPTPNHGQITAEQPAHPHHPYTAASQN